MEFDNILNSLPLPIYQNMHKTKNSYCERFTCAIELKNRAQGRPVLRVKKFTKDPNTINAYQKHMRETMKNLNDDICPTDKMKIVAELWKNKKVNLV